MASNHRFACWVVSVPVRTDPKCDFAQVTEAVSGIVTMGAETEPGLASRSVGASGPVALQETAWPGVITDAHPVIEPDGGGGEAVFAVGIAAAVRHAELKLIIPV